MAVIMRGPGPKYITPSPPLNVNIVPSISIYFIADPEMLNKGGLSKDEPILPQKEKGEVKM